MTLDGVGKRLVNKRELLDNFTIFFLLDDDLSRGEHRPSPALVATIIVVEAVTMRFARYTIGRRRSAAVIIKQNLESNVQAVLQLQLTVID